MRFFLYKFSFYDASKFDVPDEYNISQIVFNQPHPWSNILRSSYVKSRDWGCYDILKIKI